VLYSVIISLNIIRRGAATITALFVLWSTPSSSSGSLAAALLLLTEPRMHVLPCLLVFLKSGFVVLSLGLRLELAILMSPHTLLPCIQRNGTHKVVLEAYPNNISLKLKCRNKTNHLVLCNHLDQT
jgi:hypothetical protein